MSFREDCGLTQPGNTSRNRAIRSALGVLRFQLFTISLQIYYCTSGSLVMLLQIFGSPDIQLVNNNERYRQTTCGMYVPHMWYVPHRIHAFVDQYVRDAVRTMQTVNATIPSAYTHTLTVISTGATDTGGWEVIYVIQTVSGRLAPIALGTYSILRE